MTVFLELSRFGQETLRATLAWSGGGENKDQEFMVFVSLSKMSFLRPNKVEFSFLNFESKDFSIFQKKLLARSNFESFSANGEYQVNASNQRKNFSFEEFCFPAK